MNARSINRQAPGMRLRPVVGLLLPNVFPADPPVRCHWRPGLVSLGSVTGFDGVRPLAFYVVRQIAGDADSRRAALFDTNWQRQSFRHSMRVTTAVWGLLLVADALVHSAFVLSTPAATVLTLSPMVTIAFIVVAVVWTTQYGRRARGAHTVPAIANGQSSDHSREPRPTTDSN